jgi:excisionase family DNA binding protein
MLGYRGHFASKSHGYSTTMRALRQTRQDWHRRQSPHADRYEGKTVVTISDLAWAGRGWRTTATRSSPWPPQLAPATNDASRVRKPDQPEPEGTPLNKIVLRKWYSTAEVAELLGYSLTKTKFLVLSGEVRSIKDGGNRRILPEWVDDYIRRRVMEQDHVA